MGGIDEQVRELLGPGGTLARRLPGYEHREGQLRFARAVSSALEQDGTLIGEAGTGIGKSFGYLVPAILLAEERGKPVVISTRTKALQEQLNAKDLPFLQAVLPMEFTWTVAVGRNNYVCMRRFERAKKDRGTLFRDESHYEQLEAIAQLTTGSGTARATSSASSPSPHSGTKSARSRATAWAVSAATTRPAPGRSPAAACTTRSCSSSTTRSTSPTWRCASTTSLCCPNTPR
jgi:Rad3-related DNA helicase